MKTIKAYELKILLTLAAVMCFAASSMGYFFPMAAVIIRIMGYALLVWAVIEPKVEEVEE